MDIDIRTYHLLVFDRCHGQCHLCRHHLRRHRFDFSESLVRALVDIRSQDHASGPSDETMENSIVILWFVIKENKLLI